MGTKDMVAVARKRIDTGFAFVGLTEEWDLSVCLFHHMFGGECRPREFINTRPGEEREGDQSYNISLLEGVTDPFDGPIYAHVQELFWANVKAYGVSHRGCMNCSNKKFELDKKTAAKEEEAVEEKKVDKKTEKEEKAVAEKKVEDIEEKEEKAVADKKVEYIKEKEE